MDTPMLSPKATEETEGLSLANSGEADTLLSRRGIPGLNREWDGFRTKSDKRTRSPSSGSDSMSSSRRRSARRSSHDWDTRKPSFGLPNETVQEQASSRDTSRKSSVQTSLEGNAARHISSDAAADFAKAEGLRVPSNSSLATTRTWMTSGASSASTAARLLLRELPDMRLWRTLGNSKVLDRDDAVRTSRKSSRATVEMPLEPIEDICAPTPAKQPEGPAAASRDAKGLESTQGHGRQPSEKTRASPKFPADSSTPIGTTDHHHAPPKESIDDKWQPPKNYPTSSLKSIHSKSSTNSSRRKLPHLRSFSSVLHHQPSASVQGETLTPSLSLRLGPLTADPLFISKDTTVPSKNVSAKHDEKRKKGFFTRFWTRSQPAPSPQRERRSFFDSHKGLQSDSNPANLEEAKSKETRGPGLFGHPRMSLSPVTPLNGPTLQEIEADMRRSNLDRGIPRGRFLHDLGGASLPPSPDAIDACSTRLADLKRTQTIAAMNFVPPNLKRIATPPLSLERRAFGEDPAGGYSKRPHTKEGTWNSQTSSASTEGDALVRLGGGTPESEPCVTPPDPMAKDFYKRWIDEMLKEDVDHAQFEWEVPEHLPNSPLCPANPEHPSGGKGVCVYHGRRKAAAQ